MNRFHCSLIAFLMLFLLSGCFRESGSKLPYPTFHGQITYFQEKEELYSHFTIKRSDIVLVGDDLIDRGMWSDFYGSDRIKNRGIALEGTECTLYRIADIARKKPAKIFISTGLYDIKNGRKVKETAYRIDAIINTIQLISPKTDYYVLGVVADYACKKQEKSLNDSIASLNTYLKKGYKERYLDIPSVLSAPDGYLSPYYAVGDNRINGAGYEALSKYLSSYVGFQARNTIFNDPVMDLMNTSSLPAAEYYDSVYQKRFEGRSPHYIARLSIFNSIPNSSRSVVMLGNSLNNNCWWDELLGVSHSQVINRGISGDVTSGILDRLYDVIDENPSKVFILTGINDFIEDPSTPAIQVWENYKKIINTLHNSLPNTEIFIQSTLPLNPVSPFYEGRNEKAEELNLLLKGGAATLGYEFIDIASLLKDSDGNLDKKYTADGIHLLPEAYIKWRDIINLK